jgi:hypothetical protein
MVDSEHFNYAVGTEKFVGKVLEYFGEEDENGYCLFTPDKEDYWYYPKEWCTEVFPRKYKGDDDTVITVSDTTTETEEDLISSPSHYSSPIPEYEVKDILKAFLDDMENEDISLFEAGWWQQSMQYFLRFYKKNGIEDLKKGIQSMQLVVESMEKRNALESGK